MKKTLIVGYKTGIGSEIFKKFKKKSENVVGLSRTSGKSKNDIKFDISSSTKIKLNFKFDNLIFAHRYRGNDPFDEYNTMVIGPINFIYKNISNFKKNSSIIFLGSNAKSQVFMEQDIFYHASRGAIDSVTKFLSYELGNLNIKVNCINPMTLIKKQNKKFYSVKKNRYHLNKIIPNGKMTNSKNIADLCYYLCSDNSSGISGQTFVVDNGLSNISQETIAKKFL